MISAVLRRKSYLQWEKVVYPNLYVILIGPAGLARKGTAMSPGQALLRELGIKITSESTTRAALVKALKKASHSDLTAISGKTEYCALTVFSEEFTVFIGYNNQQLMADLANWYDCPDNWTYDSVAHGAQSIPGVYVNLIGATTPELLQSTLPSDAVGGGLMSRAICVWAGGRSKIVTIPLNVVDKDGTKDKLKEQWKSLIETLTDISLIEGEFKPSDSYLKCWAEWYPKQHDTIDFKERRLLYYVGRRPTHLHKLAMVFNASRHDGNLTLTDYDFRRALTLLQKTEADMDKPFAGMGTREDVDIQQAVAVEIYKRKKTTIRDLYKMFYKDIAKNDLITMLSEFEYRGYCKIDSQGSNGMPSTNPVIIYIPEKKGKSTNEESS
jgi:hypothetical protein